MAGGRARLDRVLSPAEVLLLTISALSPVLSVFLGGNAVLHLAGTGAALAFIGGALAAATIALLFAELAAGFPGAGGAYPALYGVLGPRWTFPYVMLRMVYIFPLIGFFAFGFAAYARRLVPGLPVEALALVAIVAAAGIALFNVKRGAHVVALFLAVEALAVLVLTGVAASHVTRPLSEVLLYPVSLVNGTLVPTSGWTMALAFTAGLSMCSGAEWAMYFAEDMGDAHRRIGRVVAWAGLLAALTIAIPVVLVVLAIDDLPSVLAAEAPIAEFLARSAGPWVGTLVTVGVVAAIFNAIVAAMLGLSRQLFAIGRDGIFPNPLSRLLASLHPRFHSPVGAVAVLAVLGSLCVALGEKRLILIVSGNFAEYMLMAMAVIVGRKAGKLGQVFKVPLHPLAPLVGLSMAALVIIANWNDDVARTSMAILLGTFVAAFIWHEARIRQGRPPVVLKGSDIDG